MRRFPAFIRTHYVCSIKLRRRSQGFIHSCGRIFWDYCAYWEGRIRKESKWAGTRREKKGFGGFTLNSHLCLSGFQRSNMCAYKSRSTTALHYRSLANPEHAVADKFARAEAVSITCRTWRRERRLSSWNWGRSRCSRMVWAWGCPLLWTRSRKYGPDPWARQRPIRRTRSRESLPWRKTCWACGAEDIWWRGIWKVELYNETVVA